MPVCPSEEAPRAASLSEPSCPCARARRPRMQLAFLSPRARVPVCLCAHVPGRGGLVCSRPFRALVPMCLCAHVPERGGPACSWPFRALVPVCLCAHVPGRGGPTCFRAALTSHLSQKPASVTVGFLWAAALWVAAAQPEQQGSEAGWAGSGPVTTLLLPTVEFLVLFAALNAEQVSHRVPVFPSTVG